MSELFPLLLLAASAYFLGSAFVAAGTHTRNVNLIRSLELGAYRTVVAADPFAAEFVAAPDRDAESPRTLFWPRYRCGAAAGLAGLFLLPLCLRRAAPRPTLRGATARVALAVVVVALVVPSGATMAAPSPASARDAYAAQDFDKALALLVGESGAEDVTLRALCHAEKLALYGGQGDKKAVGQLRKELSKSLGIADLEMVAHLAAIGANPHGSELAAEFMEDILKKASTRNDMDAVLGAIGARPGPRATADALKALQRHLEQLRRYVNSGGTLPVVEREFCSDAGTLELLISLLDEDVVGSLAQKCLVLIEEPALAALAGRGGDAARETTARIEDMRAKRAKHRPGTSWYGGHE